MKEKTLDPKFEDIINYYSNLSDSEMVAIFQFKKIEYERSMNDLSVFAALVDTSLKLCIYISD